MAETRVWVLITQGSQVQILPPLQSKTAGQQALSPVTARGLLHRQLLGGYQVADVRGRNWMESAVACHEHGTALSGFLPASWDHLDCQSWDHPARRVGGPFVCSLNRHVVSSGVEVISGGIQGGQCG